jgi:hypothetical protein
LFDRVFCGEFYFLAEAFNGMFQSLRSRYANLERANEDLERQVRERTHELEQLKDEAERQARTDPLALIITPPIPSFRQDAGIQCHGWQASTRDEPGPFFSGPLFFRRLNGIMIKAENVVCPHLAPSSARERL